MLLLSYSHIGGQNNALVQGTIPTSPTAGYSHVLLSSFKDGQGNSVFKAKRTRFYCQTSAHGRKMHFYTSDGVVNQMAYDGNDLSNTASRWTTGFTTLSGHTAYLPASTNAGFTGVSDGLWNFPFYNGGTYHWGIRGVGNRWECDDFVGSEVQTTLHQVWVNADIGTVKIDFVNSGIAFISVLLIFYGICSCFFSVFTAINLIKV